MACQTEILVIICVIPPLDIMRVSWLILIFQVPCRGILQWNIMILILVFLEGLFMRNPVSQGSDQHGTKPKCSTKRPTYLKDYA